jgi:hypothetical protein
MVPQLHLIGRLRMPADLSALLHNTLCCLLYDSDNFAHISHSAHLYITAHFITKPARKVLVGL